VFDIVENTEVIKMNDEVVSRNVGSWIAEMDLPVRANLRPITAYSELTKEEEDELQARTEFINWYMGSSHQILQLIPVQEKKDFWMELDDDGNDISAFNTMDYQRLNRNKFSMYHWQLKRLCEVVKDWAITYSIIKDDIAKNRIRNRAINMIRLEGKGYREKLFEVWLKYSYWK
jgi:hypothetical protein